MAEEAARPRLGRGLAALIGDMGDDDQAPARAPRDSQKRLPIEFLRANLKNPRKSFDEGELADLASSVREKGVLQPILVRAIKGAGNAFEILADSRVVPVPEKQVVVMCADGVEVTVDFGWGQPAPPTGLSQEKVRFINRPSGATPKSSKV